jgi:galactoside O-acetyltransferase
MVGWLDALPFRQENPLGGISMENQAYELSLRKVGRDVVVFPLAKIAQPECVSIGDSVIIDDFVLILGGRETRIGSFVHIASFVSILGGGLCIVEDFAGISSGTRVYSGNDDYLGGSLTGPTVPPRFRVAVRSFVHLEKHVIIGANCVILPGVTIHEGAAIGAGSVVTKDCAPWTVYAGSPVRPLKPRRMERISELERELRAQLYDPQGMYIPRASRGE